MDYDTYENLENALDRANKIEGLAFVLYDSLSSGSTEQDRKHENAAMLLFDLVSGLRTTLEVLTERKVHTA